MSRARIQPCLRTSHTDTIHPDDRPPRADRPNALLSASLPSSSQRRLPPPASLSSSSFVSPRTSNEIIKSLRTGGRLTRPPPLLKLAPIIEIQTRTALAFLSARLGRATDSPLDIRSRRIVVREKNERRMIQRMGEF